MSKVTKNIPDGQEHVRKKALEFKILLLIDNAPSHPVLDHPNIQLLFFTAEHHFTDSATRSGRVS